MLIGHINTVNYNKLTFFLLSAPEQWNVFVFIGGHNLRSGDVIPPAESRGTAPMGICERSSLHPEAETKVTF